MEKFKVSFTADNQQLKAIGTKHASDTYADIEATFVLGERWVDMDSVSAVWWNDFARIATVLDPQGKCIVPHEVLTRKGCVRVNLVGSVMEGDELVTRLTSYSAEAVQVNEKIKLTGSETSEITPSQFEQFVAQVIAEVEKVTGMTAVAETLPAGSPATARYENGVLYLGIPQGIQGETGNGIESVIFNSDYSLTFDFTDGTEFTTPSIRGAEGNGIRSITKTGTSGLVDTYTITFDDSSTTTYTVTNGAKGDKGDTGATPSFSIGTVETLEPTEDATATITGTAENPVLNLGIPQGKTGEVTYEDLESILPRDTASGQIASFPDGQSVIPMHSLKVSLEPIQDLHGYDKPWSGGAGRNLLNVGGRVNQTSAEVRYTSDDNYIILNGTKNGGGYATMYNLTLTLPTGTYYAKAFVISGTTTGTIDVYVNDGTSDITGSLIGPSERTITLESETTLRFRFAVWNDGTVLTNYTIGIVVSTTSGIDKFYPYSNICPISGHTEVNTIVSPTTEAEDGTTYTTSLGRTVYGGTLDVVSGGLVVDRAMVDMGTLNWSRYKFGSQYAFYANVSDRKSRNPNIKCAKYPFVIDGPSGMADKTINSTSNSSYIYVRDDAYTDAATFKTAMSGVQLVYELATPQTYQLAPQEVRTLLGTNNVWSDGTVTVVYSADTALWIEKKLNA